VVAGASSPGPDVVVGLCCASLDPAETRQSYCDNRLVSWEEGHHDVDIIFEIDDPSAVFGIGARDTDAADPLTVRYTRPGQPGLLWLPPLDSHALNQIVPGASFTIDLLTTHAPGGHLLFSIEVCDGIPAVRRQEDPDDTAAPPDIELGGC
jgi:hypothetical protein